MKSRGSRAPASVLLGLTVHTLREENTHYVVRSCALPAFRRSHAPLARPAVPGCGTSERIEITHIDRFGPNERGFVELYVQAIAGSRRGQAEPTVRTPSCLRRRRSSSTTSTGSSTSDPCSGTTRDPSSFERAGAAAAARDLRSAVADVLHDQHAVFGGSDSASRNIERLRIQRRLRCSPGSNRRSSEGLHNMYKAATAVRLARRLEATTGRPHVPVFWIANDDHSLDAVDHVHAVAADGTVAPITWEHGRTAAPNR